MDHSVVARSAPFSRADWLIRLRRAKCHDTLEFMADRLYESLASTKEKADLWLAFGDRQDEIDQGRYVGRLAL